jgi:hypothetical protein
MKSCSKNRKLIAWLALDALDARQARELRAHIETCGPCRRYLEELAVVKEKLSAAEFSSNAQASESFHRKLAARLRAEQPGSLWETLSAQVQAVRLNWRIALPVSAAAALVIATMVILLRPPAVSPPAHTMVRAVPPQRLQRDLSPSVSNYQRAANLSLDELDELLTAQARKRRPPAPVYTASILAVGDMLN